MQPTSRQVPAPLSSQRPGSRLGPYSAPYVFPHPGQLRPYPERRPRQRPEAERPPRIPLVAVAATLLLVITCLPGAALFGYVVRARFAGPGDLRPGWMTFVLVCPLLAVVLGALPCPRRWVTARRQFAAAHAPA